MAKKPYRPEQGGLAFRVLDWFAKNPDEELSAKDIVLKFDVISTSHVMPSLQAAIAHGLLQRAKGYGGLLRVGPAFEEWAHLRSADQSALPPTLQQAATRARRNPPPPIDITAIEVRVGTSLPRRRVGGLHGTPTLADQMDAVIAALRPNSSVWLPIDYQYVAADALARHRKAHPEKKLLKVHENAEQISINRYA